MNRNIKECLEELAEIRERESELLKQMAMELDEEDEEDEDIDDSECGFEVTHC